MQISIKIYLLCFSRNLLKCTSSYYLCLLKSITLGILYLRMFQMRTRVPFLPGMASNWDSRSFSLLKIEQFKMASRLGKESSVIIIFCKIKYSQRKLNILRRCYNQEDLPFVLYVQTKYRHKAWVSLLQKKGKGKMNKGCRDKHKSQLPLQNIASKI